MSKVANESIAGTVEPIALNRLMKEEEKFYKKPIIVDDDNYIGTKIDRLESNPNDEVVELSKVKLVLICIGLMLSIFVAAIDENIVATALGGIIKDFNDSGNLTWIAASYLLTMTAFQPLYGKFSDIFGRKPAMLIALSIFLIGSVGCGAANSLIMLIVFRAIAGIGGGGLIALPFIIMGDVVPLDKRPAYMGLIQATFALASVIGPIVGGLFVDYVSWRWVFYINIPISILSMVVTFFLIPSHTANQSDLRLTTFKEKWARVDLSGAISLVIGTICIILATNWGGKDYAWSSLPVILSFVLGIVVLAVFIYIELKVAKEPVIPSHIFTRNVIGSSITTLAFGFVMFTSLNYIPLYHQTIHHQTATQAGIETIPLALGLSTLAGTSGLLTNRTGRFRPFIWVGMACLVAGTALFGAMIRPSITTAEEIIYTLLLGVGIGLCIQLVLIASQVSVPENDMATVTAFIRYALSIGGVLGLAVHGAVFNNVLLDTLTSKQPDLSQTQINMVVNSLESFHHLDASLQALATDAYSVAYKYLFYSLVPIASVGFLASLTIRHISLKSTPNLTGEGH